MFYRLFAFLLVIFTTQATLADERYPNGTMVIGGLVAPPYVFVDTNGDATGILVVKVRQALANLGIKAEFEISNWPRSFHNAKMGHVDAVIPTLKSPDREVHLLYPQEPLAKLNMVMTKNTNNPTEIQSIDELQGKLIGRIRNARVTPELDEAAQNNIFQLEERGTFQQLALGVASGRLDFAIGPELMLFWAAGENGVLNRVKTVGYDFGSAPVYLAISKKSKFILHANDISAELRAVGESDAFEEALTPYSEFLQINLFERLRAATNLY